MLASRCLHAQSNAIYQINCGAASASPVVKTGFACDAYASGGTKYSTLVSIDTSGVTDPAPQSAYQSERYGMNFSYTFPNLLPPLTYTVRLHFAEYRYDADGYGGKPARLFNVSINGQSALSNFNVYAAAGAQYKAVVEDFPVTPDSNGKITINFVGGTDNAEIKAIEILGQQVQIDVNSTADTTDDIVRLHSQYPNREFFVPCTIQATGSPSNDLTVSLSNANSTGVLGFTTDPATSAVGSSITVTLPKDGTAQTFYITGEGKSNTVGDAVIQAADAISGNIYGTTPATVFWFFSPSITATTGNAYDISLDDQNVARFQAHPLPAIHFAGQATLMPSGLSSYALYAPQLQPLRLSMEQNFLNATYSLLWKPDSQHITWAAGVLPGTIIRVPSSESSTITVPACSDTADLSSQPLYSRDTECFQAFSTTQATQITSRDTPSKVSQVQPYYVYDENNNLVAEVDYQPTASINASFHDWGVVFDTSADVGKQTQWLTETGWKMNNVTSASGGNKTAAPSGEAFTPPHHNPIEDGSTGNQIINNGQGQPVQSTDPPVSFTR